MNIFGSEMVLTNLRKLSDEEEKAICQKIEKQTAVLKYYTNLYKLFLCMRTRNDDNYVDSITNDLAESICKLLNLEVAIPKNKSIDDIIKDDEQFRAEIKKDSKNIITWEENLESFIGLENLAQNTELQVAIANYQAAILDIKKICRDTEFSTPGLYQDLLTDKWQQGNNFVELSSLGEVIYVGKVDYVSSIGPCAFPYHLSGERIINYLVEKCESQKLTEKQFNIFLRKHIKDLLGIIRDYNDDCYEMSRASIKELISNLYKKEALRPIINGAYKSFLEETIDNKGEDLTITFLKKFFGVDLFAEYLSQDISSGEIHWITIRSIVQGYSRIYEGRTYNNIIAKVFSRENRIADGNNPDDFKCALDEAGKLASSTERSPILLLLSMTTNFDDDRINAIINYLSTKDKQERVKIAQEMINTLSDLSREKNDSKLTGQISDLIEQIKKILSEEKSNEGPQKRLGPKPPPKPLP